MFGYFFLALVAVRMFFLLDFVEFITLIGLLLLILFLISLAKRNRGEPSAYQQSTKKPGGKGRMATVAAAIFSWPTARKILGKKLSEGEQLIEKLHADKSSGAKLELDAILARARWLGRRKGSTGRGRTVSYRSVTTTTPDISVATSIRLASRRGHPLKITRDDLKANIREGRIRASMILVLDSSESMIDSLAKVRDAIRAVKKSAARMRDRVGLIVFKGEEAHVLQHPTTNFNLIMQKLGNVGLSDFTPLAAGMLRAIRMARTEQARGYAPLMVMATDGVTNVSIPRWSTRIADIPDPASDALQMAKIVSVNKWKTVVANMAHVVEDGPTEMMMATQLMMRIAEVTKGVYVGFTHRDAEAVVRDMSKPRIPSEEIAPPVTA